MNTKHTIRGFLEAKQNLFRGRWRWGKMKTIKAVTSFLEAKQDLSPRTLEQYQDALGHLAQECPTMPSSPEPLRRALMKAHTVWVKDAWWRCWKAFCRWCSEEYDIPNPMNRVARPGLPEVEMRSLEPQELPLVVAAASSLRDKAVVALALDSGLRASEFGRLRPGDVASDTVRVWGKGNRQLRVPTSPETHHLLQLLLSQDGRDRNKPFFLDSKGRPLSRFSVYHIVRGCMERAGISGPKLGPHCLRHSLGSNYIASGGDPFSLKTIMRHKNIQTTMRYVNLALGQVIDLHHKHSPAREALRGAQMVMIRREVEEILKDRT